MRSMGAIGAVKARAVRAVGVWGAVRTRGTWEVIGSARPFRALRAVRTLGAVRPMVAVNVRAPETTMGTARSFTGQGRSD